VEPGPGRDVVKHVHNREGVDPASNHPRPWRDSVFKGVCAVVGQWVVACGTQSRFERGETRLQL